MIPLDKQLHFFAGGLIAGVVFVLAGIWISLAAVAVIAAVKEGWDAFHRDMHTPDQWDFWATCCGWLPLALAFYVKNLLY